MKSSQICERVSLVALALSVFLGLTVFFPGGFLPTPMLKGYVLVATVLVAFVAWLVRCLIEGTFSVPWTRMLLAIGVTFSVLLFSSLFSGASYLSFFGEGFDTGTFAVLGSLLVGMFLISMTFTSRRRVFIFLQTFFLLYIILAVFQLFHVIYPASTSLGIFNTKVDGPVGLWSDFAFLSGAALIGFVTVLEFMRPAKFMKFISILGAGLAFFFLILCNILSAWILVGFSSIVVLVYTLITNRYAEKRHFPFWVFGISLMALFFVLANSLFGNILSSRFNTSFIDIHPSITSSVHVAGLSLRSNPVFGAGPNNYLGEWLKNRPVATNNTTLWDVPFTSGSSFFMSAAMLSGALGLIAFLMFLYAYVYESFKKVFTQSKDHKTNTPVLGIFLFSFYFMLAVVFASPGIAIVICAFAFAGILFGSLVGEGRIELREVNFLKEQRMSFFAILCIVALLMISAGTAYVATERFGAMVFFEKSLVDARVGDLVKADSRLATAISLSDLPLFERTRVLFAEQNIRQALNSSSQTATQDQLKKTLQDSISIGNSAALAAVSLNQQDPANYLILGDFLRIIYPLKIDGAYDKSKDAYNHAITLAPNYPKPYLSLAQLYFDARDNQNARTYTNKALALKNNYTEAYFLLAQIDNSEGKKDAAYQDIQNATIADPNNPDTYFQLGVIHYNNKEYTDAINSFHTVIGLNNQYLNAWYFLALCELKTGASDDAKIILGKLHKAFPDNQNVTDALNGNVPDTSSNPVPSTPAPTTPAKTTPKAPAKKTTPKTPAVTQ